MKLREFMIGFIRNYLIIFSVLVMFMTFLRQIFTTYESIDLVNMYLYMICAFIGNLPSLILYSSKELTEKQLRIRMLIHFLVLEAAILIIANLLGWIVGVSESIVVAIQIAVVYALVRLFAWFSDRKVAGKINEKLKVMNEKSEDILEVESI